MSHIERFIREFSHGALPWEAFVLAACLAAAYGSCWLIGRRQPAESIWFGRSIVDGVLFPLVALALVQVARVVLQDFQKIPLLTAALPVLVSLAGIRLIARVFMVVFPKSPLARLVERMFSWLAWFATVLWILGLMPRVQAELDAIGFVFGKTTITLLQLIYGVLSGGIVLVVALWISATIERRLLRETVSDLSLRKVASNAVRASLLLLGFLFALSAIGVDLTALSVLGGAVGVGVGFGLQKLASNYVSGFVILFERSLRIGDMVKVDNFEGVVTDIKTRYTLIRSATGRESIVPNEKLIIERVENLSRADLHVPATVEVTVAADADPDAVRCVLEEAARSVPGVAADPAPAARLERIGAGGLAFALVFSASDARQQASVRSAVNLAVLRGLRAAQIPIR